MLQPPQNANLPLDPPLIYCFLQTQQSVSDRAKPGRHHDCRGLRILYLSAGAATVNGTVSSAMVLKPIYAAATAAATAAANAVATDAANAVATAAASDVINVADFAVVLAAAAAAAAATVLLLFLLACMSYRAIFCLGLSMSLLCQ